MKNKDLHNENTPPISNGWNLFRYPTIQDGVVFRWRFGDCEVSASRNGVSVSGDWGCRSFRYDDLRETLDDAEFAFSELAKDPSWDPAMIGLMPVFEVPIMGEERDARLRHHEKVARFYDEIAAAPSAPDGWNSLAHMPFTVSTVENEAVGYSYQVLSSAPLLRLIDDTGSQYVARPADGDLSESGYAWSIWTGSDEIPLELEEGREIVGWLPAERAES